MTPNDPLQEDVDRNRPWERVRDALNANDAKQIQVFLDELSLAEALRTVLHLDEDDRARVLSMIDAQLAADLLEEAPSEQAAELFEDLQTDKAVKILDELESDQQVDLIAELDEGSAAEILSQMNPSDAQEIRRMADYAPTSAGGLMTSEAFAFDGRLTADNVLRQYAQGEQDFERYRGQHPYIIDQDRKLLGVVSLRNLLTAPRYQELTDMMTEVLSVTPDTPLSELEDLIYKHPFLGLPVVDEEARLIGAVSRSAITEALLERSESDSLKRQGLVGDELRSLPTLLRARRRLAWLSGNIVLNIIAASVIAAYTDVITAVIAIAVFLPMVSDMSGCSGNQAVAVSLRELALGLTKPFDVLEVWLKEVSVGLINGGVLGVLIALVAWGWMGNPYLGLVIGLALAINTLISVSIGGVVPLVLKRYQIDPAVASGPILTTATDIAGFFLVLSLATLFMPLLIA